MVGDAVEDVVELLLRRHRAEFLVGKLDRDVQVALMAHVDDGAARIAVRVIAVQPGADQQTRDGLYGSLRGREADAHRRRSADVLQSLQSQRQVRSALVACNRMNLVDDDGAHCAQHRP